MKQKRSHTFFNCHNLCCFSKCPCPRCVGANIWILSLLLDQIDSQQLHPDEMISTALLCIAMHWGGEPSRISNHDQPEATRRSHRWWLKLPPFEVPLPHGPSPRGTGIFCWTPISFGGPSEPHLSQMTFTPPQAKLILWWKIPLKDDKVPFNSLSVVQQARKARRCDSYLKIWNYQWLTDPLTDWLTEVGARRCYRILKTTDTRHKGTYFKVANALVLFLRELCGINGFCQSCTWWWENTSQRESWWQTDKLFSNLALQIFYTYSPRSRKSTENVAALSMEGFMEVSRERGYNR